jgi:predicted bacteriocin transport accessory protein
MPKRIALFLAALILGFTAGFTYNQNHHYEWNTDLSIQEGLDLIESDTKSILYFGYPTCPWCKEAAPVMQEVAKKERVKVYYICITDENGETLLTDALKSEIQEYMNKSDLDFSEYFDEDTGEFRFYVPTVMIVGNGQIYDFHIGTVDTHDAHERTMTDEEVEELTQIYTDMFKSTKKWRW